MLLSEYEKYTVILTLVAGVSKTVYFPYSPRYQGEYDSVFFILTLVAGVSMKNTLPYSPQWKLHWLEYGYSHVVTDCHL